MSKNMMVGLLAALCSAAAFAGSDLVVKVEGINKAEGRVRVALYDQAKYFKKQKKAITVQEALASTEPVVVKIRDLPAGNYAVHVVHDQNANGGLDHLIGLFSREGYGLSVNNDLKAEETFANSQFAHDGSTVTDLAVQMRYCGNGGQKSMGRTLKCWISVSP